MPTDQQSQPARIAAVVALSAAFVIFLVVVITSFSGEDSEEPARGPAAQQERSADRQESGGGERRVYVVKPGDCCLSQIAEKTGIDVDELVDLNPNLDPQAIRSGDRVKLR